VLIVYDLQCNLIFIIDFLCFARH